MNMADENALTTSIRTLPALALFAYEKRYGNAWRAWILLRHLDSTGSGFVSKQSASNWAEAMGITKRHWLKWVKKALDANFIQSESPLHAQGNTPAYHLSSAVKVAIIVGCENVGYRPVTIPLNLLICDDYYRFLWMAFLATLPPKPVSRETLRTLSKVPERNQLRYEKALDITVTTNIAITPLPVNHLDGYIENKVKHAFAFRDPETGQLTIAFQLPNTYIVEEKEILTCSRGSTTMVNRKLKQSISANMSWEKTSVRIYHENEDSKQAAYRKMRDKDVKNVPSDKPERMYTKRHTNNPHKAYLYDVEEI